MLSLVGRRGIADADLVVQVDEYVPLRFRSYAGLIEVRAVRYGDFDRSLVEFDLDSENVLRGFTLIAYCARHSPRTPIQNLKRSTGLPVLNISQTPWEGPEGARRVDVRRDFSLGIGEGFVELDLGSAERIQSASEILVAGQIEFCFSLFEFVGLRVLGLSSREIEMIGNQVVE